MLLLEIPSLTWSEELWRVVVAAGSAVRSASSGSCASVRRASARTCSSRSAPASSRSSRPYGFNEFLVGGGNVVRTDPTRIAAQIVTGVGFLGAGAIIRQGFSVRGLTTAATLWVGRRDRDGLGRRLLLGRRDHDRASCSSRSGRCGSSPSA
jgi:hypothetical protein